MAKPPKDAQHSSYRPTQVRCPSHFAYGLLYVTALCAICDGWCHVYMLCMDAQELPLLLSRTSESARLRWVSPHITEKSLCRTRRERFQPRYFDISLFRTLQTLTLPLFFSVFSSIFSFFSLFFGIFEISEIIKCDFLHTVLLSDKNSGNQREKRNKDNRVATLVTALSIPV